MPRKKSDSSEPVEGESAEPTGHYQREKARRARKATPESTLLAEAQREYEALLAAQAARGKGGRPKKTKNAPATDDVLDGGDDSDIE